jgi:GntR family transcriptional regulator
MAPPMYQRIADDLRNRIESGAFAPDGKLPPEGELQKGYDASRNTIRDAIKQLVSLGLVQTRPGQGTFVTGAIDPFVTTLSVPAGSGFGGGEGATYLSQVAEGHRKPSVSKPRVEIQIPAPEVAGRLRIEADAQVVSRHQERYIDETPWSLQTSFYPLEFALKAPDLLKPEDIAVGAMSYLETTEGIKQVGYRDWITARTADEHEQAFFGIAAHATVFELFRTAFDVDGRPVRVTVTVCPTDRNQFIVNVGKVPDPQYDLPAPENQAGEPGHQEDPVKP